MVGPLQRAYLRLKTRLRRPIDAAFLPTLRGVVHVGANTGQERRIYDSYRLPVLWIEPIPEVFARLEKNIASYPDQRALCALLAELDGRSVDFHVASNDGASSSMLAPRAHKALWPEVGFTPPVRMTTSTLPSVLAAAGLDIARYNGLVMDTQGSELLVLQGAESMLHRFDIVKTVAADFEAYKDCCQLRELGDFMAAHGFDEVARRRFPKLEPGQAYYDVVFRRR